MSKIRCAVIGVGYLGRFHAQKYQALSEIADLVAVCDVNPGACATISQELDVPAVLNYRDLFEQVDAVSIAATTHSHFSIAKDCLMHGIHVLLEKPMTETVEQARELIQIAESKQLTFQIGHLEQFNAARLAIDAHLDQPLFIESQRLAPFNPRGTDVNVILDLMIHDIDIIQSMVKSPLKNIEAQGAPVLTQAIDIANARLTFENGCVANVSASRVSFKAERKTRIFQRNAYISIDFQNKQFAVFQKGEGQMFPGIPDIVRHAASFEQGDALLAEIKAFLRCITQKEKPIVNGEAGLHALETATKITHLIEAHLERLHAEA
jgi:predicted dehydrogenase